jgi:hypothetical protein
MSGFLRLGGTLLLIAFAAWFYEDTYGKLPFTDDLDYYIALIGAGCIVFALILGFFNKVMGVSWKLRRKGKCSRCGRRVKRGELYCEFHQNEVQAEYLSGLSDENKTRRPPTSME